MHHVRKQTFHVSVDSEALAFALQPRLQDLNRTVLLPVIERVFDELSPADHHIHLERLDVDLGTISIADLDRVVDRFERGLREAVLGAILRIERQPSSAGRIEPNEYAQLELVERYLLMGTLPFWVSASTFSLEEWLTQLLTTAPEGLAHLLRRHRFDVRVLQRIVHQLSEEALQRLLQELLRFDRAALEDLLRQLAPEDADWIVTYVVELARTPGRDRAQPSLRAIITGSTNDRRKTEARLWDSYRTDRTALVALIRDIGRRPVVERFLMRLDRRALEDLVRQLDPTHADQIAADVAELARMPYVTQRTDVNQALRHLWLMTVDVQLRTLDQPYDRQAFVRAVLAALMEGDEPGREGEEQSLRAIITGSADHRTPLPVDEVDDEARLWESYRTDLVRQLDTKDAEQIMVNGVELARMPFDRPSGPQPMFTPYDRVEALQYYMHHGVLPWSISLLRPELTVADALDALPDLSLPLLRALSADLRADERLRAWHRIVRDLPHERVTRFIAALIVRAALPAAPTWSHLSAQVAEATDQPLVYAQFVVRVIDEARTHASIVVPRSSIQEDTVASPWETHRIKAVLSSRARSAAQTRADEPSSLALLVMLIDHDVGEARHFLGALKHAGVALSALVDEIPSARAVSTIQKLLEPEAASRVTRLLDALEALAPAHRPADEHVYSVVVTEILEQLSVPRLGEAFFDAMLHGLVGWWRADIGRDVPETASPSQPPSFVEALVRISRDVVAEGKPRLEAAERATHSTDEETARTWLQRLGVVSDDAGRPLLPDDALRHALLHAIDEAPEEVHVVLVERIGDADIRARWVKELSEPELVRLAYVLEPRLHRVLFDAAELLFSAWLSAMPALSPWETRRAAFWLFLLGFLADTRNSGRSLDRLVARFFEAFGAGEHNAPTAWDESQPPPAHAIERLISAAAERASAVGSAALRAILDRDRAALIARWGAHPPQSPSDSASTLSAASGDLVTGSQTRAHGDRARMAFSMHDEGGDVGAVGAEPIYVSNAGLVLANPFLPQWFRALDLLETDEEGKTQVIRDRIFRAVHLLQWLVDGSVASPEPLLCLNKLLCGLTLPTPVQREIEPTPRELEVCQLLLKSMLANWTIISATSIEGLQETFLRREGRLERTEGGWRLFVQRKTVDVLLDQVPWSISTVFHAWMPEPIFVTW